MSPSAFTPAQRRTAAATAIRERDNGTRKYCHNVAADYGVSTRTIENWMREFFPIAAARPDPATRRSVSHPLLGVAGCRWCHRAFIHGRDHLHRPVYTCAPGCRRVTPVGAQELHARIVDALYRHVPHLATERGIRAAADAFTRISVGATAAEVCLAWRPCPVLS